MAEIRPLSPAEASASSTIGQRLLTLNNDHAPAMTGSSARSTASRPIRVSDAFHAALGFAEVGSASLPDGIKTVRYLARRLTG